MSKPVARSRRHQPQDLEILYEDRDVIVIDKAPGLLTIATDKGETRTAYFRLMDYVRKGNAKSHNRIFIVHRLDRDVSGILVFAKTAEAKQHLQEHWDETEKRYLAVVHGTMANPSGTISSCLVENEARFVHSTRVPGRGSLSHTAYRVLKEIHGFSLLEVNLLTGRKNQIRVHLAESGHPIVGDRKYGPKDKEYRRIALHAFSLSFTHPYSGKPLTVETPVPGYFRYLVGNIEAKDMDGASL